jgi:hypothetical protein
VSADITLDELEARDRRKGVAKPRPKGTLPFLPDADELDALVEWLTAALRPPPGWQFERFDRASQRRADPCTIAFRSGRERRKLYFERQADLRGGNVRGELVGVSGGWLRTRRLTDSEKEDVWVGLCYVGQILSTYDDRDETRKWIEELLDATVALRGHTLAGEPERRHDALMAIRRNGEFHQADARAMVQQSDSFYRRPVRFVDEETGEQWVRAGEAFTFIYHVGGAKIDRPGLKARLASIGVESRHFEARQDPHPKATLYRLTDALVEYVEDGAAPAPAPAPTNQQEAAF